MSRKGLTIEVKIRLVHGVYKCESLLICELTVPSGSISNKCFGVCSCNPVRTYCPGLFCDSRTKKSPSCFSNASAACRLIDAWNHCSVKSCDLCTSADSENGSVK